MADVEPSRAAADSWTPSLNRRR